MIGISVTKEVPPMLSNLKLTKAEAESLLKVVEGESYQKIREIAGSLRAISMNSILKMTPQMKTEYDYYQWGFSKRGFQDHNLYADLEIHLRNYIENLTRAEGIKKLKPLREVPLQKVDQRARGSV